LEERNRVVGPRVILVSEGLIKVKSSCEVGIWGMDRAGRGYGYYGWSGNVYVGMRMGWAGNQSLDWGKGVDQHLISL